MACAFYVSATLLLFATLSADAFMGNRPLNNASGTFDDVQGDLGTWMIQTPNASAQVEVHFTSINLTGTDSITVDFVGVDGVHFAESYGYPNTYELTHAIPSIRSFSNIMNVTFIGSGDPSDTAPTLSATYQQKEVSLSTNPIQCGYHNLTSDCTVQDRLTTSSLDYTKLYHFHFDPSTKVSTSYPITLTIDSQVAPPSYLQVFTRDSVSGGAAATTGWVNGPVQNYTLSVQQDTLYILAQYDSAVVYDQSFNISFVSSYQTTTTPTTTTTLHTTTAPTTTAVPTTSTGPTRHPSTARTTRRSTPGRSTRRPSTPRRHTTRHHTPSTTPKAASRSVPGSILASALTLLLVGTLI
jgi:hypothetical protein